MPDERGLSGLSPYDLQDIECARLAGWFAALGGNEWSVPSRCEGWSRRDMLAHLVAVEEYFAACLDRSVAQLMHRYTEAGATSVDEFGAAGVANAAGRSPDDLLASWIAANERNRAGFRAADRTDIDSSVGPYPARLQAFHVAFEYAIHANDVDAPLGETEREGRQHWLAGVAQFALTELKPDLRVDISDTDVIVRTSDDSDTIEIGIDTFVDGVSRRLAPEALDAAVGALLDLGY
jgi:uncharacterized protein (TIGR03083 family)